jgi:hypothetical protein
MGAKSFMRTDGRKDKGTDGHEASIRLSQFCERAWKIPFIYLVSTVGGGGSSSFTACKYDTFVTAFTFEVWRHIFISS